MPDPADYPLAYCTNVHAGSDLATVRSNLDSIAVEVKRQFSPDDPMGIGLWVSDLLSKKIVDDDQQRQFGDFLAVRGLVPFTFNGFPFGDFHQPVVKHKVYEPTWASDERLDYTVRLASILHHINPAGMECSVSTLPLGWPGQSNEFEQRCATQLIRCANSLCDLESRTNRLVYVCIEPEPGCCLDTSKDVVRYFERWIFRGETAHDERMKRYLRVCHDVCHSAVMFEGQGEAISNYRQAGIQVGKIQVSSAVEARLKPTDPEANDEILRQLGQFDEPKYLHQTSIRADDGQTRFFEDLKPALQSTPTNANEIWRTHFHVPIFLESIGALATTQRQIGEMLTAFGSQLPAHLEVETYAWNVLPGREKFQLADGIAREMQWFAEQVATA